MNRNHFWKLLIILLVVVWSVAEFTPLTNRDLIQTFRARSVRRDETFNKIISRAQELQKTNSDRAYGNLLEAVGTNDLTQYFPQIASENQGDTDPTIFILNSIQRQAAGRVKLGIDLAGGTSFLVEMNTNALGRIETKTNALGGIETVTNTANIDVKGALSQAVEVLRKRVDSLGVAEPVIRPEGSDRIRIELPGASEADTQNARERIQKVAFLEFRLVHPESSTLIERGVTPPGYEILSSSRTEKDGKKRKVPYLVKKKAEMIGGIQRAGKDRDNIGRPQILFQLDAAHAALFGKITSENQGHFLAIVLDGVLQSAPVINSAILGGSGVIEGDYTEEEADSLISVLENPLQTPVKIIDTRTVDPTLGKDTIASGIKACVIGIIAVAGFMAIYYFLAGLIADVALIINVVILLGVMCSIGTTFTMPGIAGVVLTIGMAVDANVLIFERIREEKAKGKSLRGALQAGYDRAFGTIFDSHVTTLISSIILWKLGTGSVKGFGVTLTIGVAASLFTALVVTRLIFDFLIHKDIVKSIPMLHLIPATLKLDFMKLAAPAFVISWLLIAIGNGYGIYRGVAKHDVFGVEFVGGENITMNFDQQHKPGVDKIREVASKASGHEVQVAYQRDISSATDTLRITARQSAASDNQAGDVSSKIVSALTAAFPEANFNHPSVDSVGPAIGKEIQETAIIAALLAMFGILVYVAFRYEVTFAVGAVIAIIHDIFMTLGCYFLVGKELNATTVAAVLTIIGFSINDTIVIFDRIREDLKMGVRGSFRDIINQALNQTLSRTIITSGTVFLATLSLYIFGGGVINDFAFAFLVGIITGTYSSIYIASAWVLFWQNWRHKGARPQIGSAQVAVETTPVPQQKAGA
jgi:SecD/SecF fusion protein